jgi:hypothetical protein
MMSVQKIKGSGMIPEPSSFFISKNQPAIMQKPMLTKAV